MFRLFFIGACLLLLLLTSCDPNSTTLPPTALKSTTLLASAEMEGTIPTSSRVEFKPFEKGSLQRNDIVLFESTIKEANAETIQFLRIVGIPGDKILIDSGNIYVNNSSFALPESSKFSYYVRFRDTIDYALVTGYFNRPFAGLEYYFFLDAKEAETVRKSPTVDSFSKLIAEPDFIERRVIRNSTFKRSNSYYLGPLLIPSVDQTITKDILSIVPNYLDKNDLGKKIKENYYYVVGDNRFVATDSRYLGLIPESVIKGKLVRKSS